MRTTVTKWGFQDAFEKSHTYKNNFSHEGLNALYDYLEEYEDSTDTKIEFDMVALCCEYSEYDSAYEAMEQYQSNDMPVEGEDGDDLIEIQQKNEAKALEWLQEHTQVFEVEGGHIIIQDF